MWDHVLKGNFHCFLTYTITALLSEITSELYRAESSDLGHHTAGGSAALTALCLLLLSHWPGSQLFEIQLVAGAHSIQRLWGRILPFLSQLLVAPEVCQLVATSLSLFHIIFPTWVPVITLSLFKDTRDGI